MFQLMTILLFMISPFFLQEEKEMVLDVRVSSADAPPAEQIKVYKALKARIADEAFTQLKLETFEALELFNTEIDYAEIDYSVLNACIVMYTNKFRNLKGVEPLSFQPMLRDAAALHSIQMVNKRFYGHENASQRKLRTVVDRLEFLGFGGRNMAENLGRDFIHHYDEKSPYWFSKREDLRCDFYYGDSKNVSGLIVPKTYRELAKSIVAAWAKSPQHRANMLDKAYSWVGVAALIDFVNVENNKLPKVFVTQVFGG